MIKITLVLSAFLFSMSAFASWPRVGTQIVYETTKVKGGKATVTEATTDIIQFDAQNNSYLLRTVGRFTGRPDEVEEYWMDDILTREDLVRLVKECETSLGGERETVTVPSGTFPSCSVLWSPNDTFARSWYAVVPFNAVKAQWKSDGATYTQVLKSFRE